MKSSSIGGILAVRNSPSCIERQGSYNLCHLIKRMRHSMVHDSFQWILGYWNYINLNNKRYQVNQTKLFALNVYLIIFHPQLLQTHILRLQNNDYVTFTVFLKIISHIQYKYIYLYILHEWRLVIYSYVLLKFCKIVIMLWETFYVGTYT